MACAAKPGKFPFDVATVEIVGAFPREHLREKLGRHTIDCRRTRHARVWAVAGTGTRSRRASGRADLKSGGVITTPGVAYLARSLSADAGVVIQRVT